MTDALKGFFGVSDSKDKRLCAICRERRTAVSTRFIVYEGKLRANSGQTMRSRSTGANTCAECALALFEEVASKVGKTS